MTYVRTDDRYEHLRCRRFGRSGLQLPAGSLGLSQNFRRERDLRPFATGCNHGVHTGSILCCPRWLLCGGA